ncbi:MAG: SDR family NAD(P)-dependent oxidoreductase [Actinobacteria bacterium]|nr:SDR family NAD(P)-dependent oxidoreductase [Actinomycetota bacterium]
MNQVLITGGGGGIGRAASAYFAQMGWKVYSCDIAIQEKTGENIIPVLMDIRKADSVHAAFNLIETHTQRLDAIVNLAGVYIMDSLVEVPEEDFIRMFDINVNGAYRVNKQFLPLIKNGGRIIIITSELSGLDPLPFNGIYSITKSTLEAYAHSLRLELALLDIPVITIRPGPVDTNLLKDSFLSMEKMCAKTRLYGISTAKFHQIMKKETGRHILPQKLAELIYRSATTSHPRPSYSVGNGFFLRFFSALPAGMQAALLKKLLK